MDTKALELEIARLQELRNNLSMPLATLNQPSPVEDLRETVRQILREELAVTVTPEPTKLPLLAAVGTGLSEEQQQWLSTNQDKLPEFFMSNEGHAITRRFFTLYKEFVCK
jgi:hypothetical protein